MVSILVVINKEEPANYAHSLSTSLLRKRLPMLTLPDKSDVFAPENPVVFLMRFKEAILQLPRAIP